MFLKYVNIVLLRMLMHFCLFFEITKVCFQNLLI